MEEGAREAPLFLYIFGVFGYSVPVMAKAKYSDNLIGLKCTVCNRRNYYAHKNRKSVERKIEIKKYCPWDRKHTPHKEVKLGGK